MRRAAKARGRKAEGGTESATTHHSSLITHHCLILPAGCKSITGWEAIGRVLEVDQTPIGKTPRSCPATYVGFWDQVRRLYAEMTESRMRGYTASRFSFNTAGGRCEAARDRASSASRCRSCPTSR